ncbi:hypothetical protein COY90_03545, partial [Candidatus Roizmanbacteria bacterium CG_4_10_14_0_8_um_filter_39_9]
MNDIKLKNATSIHHHLKKIKQAEYMKILTLRTVGNFMILSSVFMIAKTFYLPVSQEIRYSIEAQAKKTYVVADSKVEEDAIY